MKRPWLYRTALWLNMLLWLGAFGAAWVPNEKASDGLKAITAIGLVFSAAVQHQAYAEVRGMRSSRIR